MFVTDLQEESTRKKAIMIEFPDGFIFNANVQQMA